MMKTCRLAAPAALLAALGLPAWAASPPATDPVMKLAWLSGCWAAEGGEVGSGESWTSVAGGTLLGVGRTVRKGRTAETEFMTISLYTDDGRLAYTARPSGQPPVTFVQTRLTAHEVVFENLLHDFPQRVAYRLEGKRLKARIEGPRGGENKVIEFPMTRVSCDAQVARSVPMRPADPPPPRPQEPDDDADDAPTKPPA
ncbi:MAG: DUF6265 family protein [Pseudomonadota bacterium]